MDELCAFARYDPDSDLHSLTFNHESSTRRATTQSLTAMAPVKKNKAPAKANNTTVKQGKDRVVKRPARGFHRFRSGILNVTPKGGEKELQVSS